MGGSLIALAVACHASPDIVATQKADADTRAGLNIGAGQRRCEPGRYAGHMNTLSDGGIAVPFSADINFSLVPSLAGEIYVLQDEQMLTGNNENGSHFTAIINGGTGCSEGSFSTQLSDGKYWTTSDSTATPVQFEGSIEGTYTAEFLSFAGNWSTTMHLPGFDLPVSGRWSANYAGPVANSSN